MGDQLPVFFWPWAWWSDKCVHYEPDESCEEYLHVDISGVFYAEAVSRCDRREAKPRSLVHRFHRFVLSMHRIEIIL